MADDEIVRLCTLMYLSIIAAICAYNIERDKYKRPRKMWVKPWILCRKVQGAYHTLFNELLNIDQESFRNYMRMDFCVFEHLLSMIENDALKIHTAMRQSLSPREKLSITLRFWAIGL